MKKSVIALAMSVALAQAGTISDADITQAQQAWGECIVAIGQAPKKEASNVASQCIDTLYGYNQGGVLFKPTKAAKQQFRLNKADALSYFVGGGIKEDHGFALQPWTKVRFENAKNFIDSDSALSMGNYYFTDRKTHKEVKVEYTFGYLKDTDGKMRIVLHHSSLPYEPKH